MKAKIEAFLDAPFLASGKFKVDEKIQTLATYFSFAHFSPALCYGLGLTGWTHQQQIITHAVNPPLETTPQIKNVIAVSSGKGGVGKSTTVISLAHALAQNGLRVGILDADIYGPSQPLMLGLEGQQPEKEDDESDAIPPMVAHGIQSMSIGYLMERKDSPAIWRGPMVSKALQQLFIQTQWHKLDFLLIDMPPGTGDIPLTLVQKFPLTASIICTTPQDIALLDARKAYQMFNKVNVPVLGVVENMASFECPHCHEHSDIFGSGGAEKLYQEYQLPLLGKVPLDIGLREKADSGEVHDLLAKHDKLKECYQRIATNMSLVLSKQKKDYSGKVGKVLVQ